MTPTDILTETLACLEAALRDTATRAAKPEMPARLALTLLQLIVSLARTMRQCRAAAGLPREWSTELMLVLGSVQLAASARLHDPTLNDTQAIRLIRLMAGLGQAVVQALPVPEKVKKVRPNPIAQPKAPPAEAKPAPTPRHRSDEWDHIGKISTQAIEAAAMRHPEAAAALRAAKGMNTTA